MPRAVVAGATPVASKPVLNKQVAAELKISEVTVKLHRGQAMRKMPADSLSDLVRMVEKLGIRARKQS